MHPLVFLISSLHDLVFFISLIKEFSGLFEVFQNSLCILLRLLFHTCLGVFIIIILNLAKREGGEKGEGGRKRYKRKEGVREGERERGRGGGKW